MTERDIAQAPNNFNTRNSFWYNKHVQRFGLPVIGALAAVGIAGCSSSSEAPVNAGADRVASATIDNASQQEVTLEVAKTMDSSAFAELDPATRIDAWMPQIEEWRGDTWNILTTGQDQNGNSNLTANERTAIAAGVLRNSFPADKNDYTRQDILNQYGIDLYDTSIQIDPSSTTETTEEQHNNEEQMLSVIMSPDNPNYSGESSDHENVKEQLRNGQGGIHAFFKDISDSNAQRFYGVTFRGHTVGSLGAELIKVENINTSEETYVLFTLYKTPKGNSVWQFTDQYSANDGTIVADYQKAVQGSVR